MVGSATKLNCPHVQMAGDRVKENITFAHQGYIMLGWAIWNCQHLINYCQLYRFNLTAKRQEESHPLANTYSSLHLYVSWFRLIKLFTLYNILWAFCWKPEIQRGHVAGPRSLLLEALELWSPFPGFWNLCPLDTCWRARLCLEDEQGSQRRFTGAGGHRL